MSDLLEVDVVGEAPPARGGEKAGAPSWGLPAAIAVFGVLAVAVLVVVVSPAMSRSGQAPSVKTPTSPPEREDGELRDIARAALSEWGRFAVSGDARVLTGHFHPDGPQYQQLVREAPVVVSANREGEAYQVTSSITVRERLPDRALVTARVVWKRRGEPDQRMAWSMELRPTPAGHWALWTVDNSRP